MKKTKIIAAGVVGIVGAASAFFPGASEPASSSRSPGRVVAVAQDGACVVQRGTHVDVSRASSTETQQLPIGDTSASGGRYGISEGARFVARVVDETFVEVWDVVAARRVHRLDLAAELPRYFHDAWWRADSWGAPSFLGEDTLVTHHRQGLALWDRASGRVRCVVQDPAMSLTRATFRVGGDRAMSRSSSNTPGIQNAALVEFDVGDCGVRARHLVPARDPVIVAGTGTTVFFLSINGIRVKSSDAVHESVFDPRIVPHALAVSSDERWVLWSGADPTRHAEQIVGVWNRSNNTMSTVATLSQDAEVLHLRIEDDGVRALDSTGRTYVWRMPPANEWRPVRPQAVTRDELNRERAIVSIGLGEMDAALSALGNQASTSEMDNMLRAYLQSLVNGEDEAAFQGRLHRENIRYAGNNSAFRLVEALAAAEAYRTATDLFLYWLEDAQADALPESGAELGLELALQFSEANEYETETDLLEKLRRVYPNNAQVIERLAESEEAGE